ncbi:MAG: serine/threonine protein kinase, partial [Planctomycetota bacterium]
MSHSERLCPSCGRPLPASGPPACPRCLLDRALAGSQSSPLVQTAAGAPIDANAGALPDPAELARHFPRLEIGELLGRGAMGSVWRARQLELSRDVALKVLAPATSNDPSFRARFEREARALAALDHPHIVRVYDYGQAGPYSFLLMELVEGASLRELLQQGRLGEAEVLGLARDTCAALAYAHARGVVHRDIKPENLLVDGAGRIKVADFGLAKLVGPAATASLRSSGGERVGTPLYMAPEQLEQPASVDHRADLYALGVVLYELLTGELPIGRFDAPSKRGSPSARYDSVVLRALEKDREQRQRDAEEVQSELDAATSGPEPVATPAPSPSAAAAGTPKLELSRTALFFSERFRYTDYLLAGLLLLGIQALPFSKPLRALLTLAFCSGLVAVVFVAIRALRGTARGHGLQFTASTLGAGLAVLGGLHADQLLHALFGSEAALTNADRYLTWAICAVEAVLLSIW